ncbi:DUF378 domain-containing protein [Cohnella sp. GCM10020058]|uniref:DUF378 domain-containing protein n=1 Tax=Cohnella sp. GCM10020058 TaxID=3317330 RepID=UPI003643FD8E
MKTLNAIALAILIIGGINWLLVGLFKYDLVAEFFGGQEEVASRIVYTIVGICALYAIKFFNDVSSDSRAR